MRLRRICFYSDESCRRQKSPSKAAFLVRKIVYFYSVFYSVITRPKYTIFYRTRIMNFYLTCILAIPPLFHSAPKTIPHFHIWVWMSWLMSCLYGGLMSGLRGVNFGVVSILPWWRSISFTGGLSLLLGLGFLRVSSDRSATWNDGSSPRRRSLRRLSMLLGSNLRSVSGEEASVVAEDYPKSSFEDIFAAEGS